MRLFLTLFALLQAASGADGTVRTPLSADDLDPDAFVEWIEKEQPPARQQARDAIWTRTTRPDFRGITFGDSATPGLRHLRVGLKKSIPIGSILVRGGGQLSVLKADALYPGDPARDADWLAAERIKGNSITSGEVGRDEFAIWTLPPGTTTRALRFTHAAQAADPRYAGWLGGALLWEERVTNIAPQAIVSATARDEAAAKLIDCKDEQWASWDNGKEGAPQLISPEHPESVMLVWPREVSLAGLEAIWAGFSAADLQIYTGSNHPREAAESDWKTLRSFNKLENGYPLPLFPNPLPFDEPVTTRAVRLKLTAATTEGHSHLKGNTRNGKRLWLGELMALQPLGTAELKSALLPAATTTHPPIPVHFKLTEAGFVTLVIEDAEGKRVRNLISETRFPAGDNIAWWDGTDDLGRDHDAARHGLYHIPERPVSPGNYQVRGLFHKGLDLRYEFSIYNAGNPAWETEDKTGGWLTNHTPPQAMLFVPADKTPTGKPLVYIGSAISEGGAGLAWVGLDGKKLGGRGWIGGNWTAAPSLARDEGKNALPDLYAYVGATWTSSANNADKTHGELRITGLSAKGDKSIIKHAFTPPPPDKHAEMENDANWIGQLGGIAVRDGLIAASLSRLNRVLFIDARTGTVRGEAAIENPRGLLFDPQGQLLILSGTRLLRYAINPADPSNLPPARMLVATGLQDPQGLTLDTASRIYVSDRGDSHQIKVFTPEGAFVLAIGHSGKPKAGLYDPLHMNNPHGIAIDENQQLWVAENDFQPKRISVWSLDGKLIRAAYGPCRYGGGGTLDPRDKTRFYYDGIEFKLDWKNGTSSPAAIFHRPGPDDFSSQRHVGPPETPFYVEGRQYMTNCFNSNPTNGVGIATIWQMKGHVAVPVAALGRAEEWALLRSEAFQSRWPEGNDPGTGQRKNTTLFAWSDLNGDAAVQPGEVTMMKGASGGVTVMPDLAFVESRVEEKAMRFPPKRFTAQGAPIYDLAAGEIVATGTQSPASSGGDQGLVGTDGWTILTVAPKPFAKEGIAGIKNGIPLWSYPSLWPGLHASHEAPVPDRAGELIGTTRLVGGLLQAPKGSDAGSLWCINGNMGDMYLFTTDGLFIAQLFQDSRIGKRWSMPGAERGMRLNELTLHDENFFPTIAQTTEGSVYLSDGARTSLIRVDGLETVTRLPARELRVTGDDLKNAAEWRLQAEAQRQLARGTGRLRVALKKGAPIVDGKLDEWIDAEWAVIDRRGTAANFDSDSRPYDVTGALSIAGGRLYAAFRTQEPELLKNSGETATAPFKTGGCLDLMIGAAAGNADPKRTRPIAGDQRLLITQVKGKTVALLYRAVVPGTREPVPFSSPWRTITIDRVDDVSADVELAVAVDKEAKGKGSTACYEISLPLARLGLDSLADGQSIKGDIGILRGNGFQTFQRVYWNNKATGITADVPSEAELTPALWGQWLFQSVP